MVDTLELMVSVICNYDFSKPVPASENNKSGQKAGTKAGAGGRRLYAARGATITRAHARMVLDQGMMSGAQSAVTHLPAPVMIHDHDQPAFANTWLHEVKKVL